MEEVIMDRMRTNSCTIISIAYNMSTNTLELQFSDGSLYRYFDVPESVYEGLLRAESVGMFFNAHIRDAYRYERLPTDTAC